MIHKYTCSVCKRICQLDTPHYCTEPPYVEKYKTTLGDAPICEVCGLYSFETSNHEGKQMCPLCIFKEGDKMEPGYRIRPSELELRIRKEVMDAVEELIDQSGPNTYLERRVGELGAILQDRLNLLWGDND